jgi:hypothetical protein
MLILINTPYAAVFGVNLSPTGVEVRFPRLPM